MLLIFSAMGAQPKHIVCLLFVASFAFMLPMAILVNIIIYGYGWLSIPKMSKAWLILKLIDAVIVSTSVLVFLKSLIL